MIVAIAWIGSCIGLLIIAGFVGVISIGTLLDLWRKPCRRFAFSLAMDVAFFLLACGLACVCIGEARITLTICMR